MEKNIHHQEAPKPKKRALKGRAPRKLPVVETSESFIPADLRSALYEKESIFSPDTFVDVKEPEAIVETLSIPFDAQEYKEFDVESPVNYIMPEQRILPIMEEKQYSPMPSKKIEDIVVPKPQKKKESILIPPKSSGKPLARGTAPTTILKKKAPILKSQDPEEMYKKALSKQVPRKSIISSVKPVTEKPVEVKVPVKVPVEKPAEVKVPVDKPIDKSPPTSGPPSGLKIINVDEEIPFTPIYIPRVKRGKEIDELPKPEINKLPPPTNNDTMQVTLSYDDVPKIEVNNDVFISVRDDIKSLPEHGDLNKRDLNKIYCP